MLSSSGEFLQSFLGLDGKVALVTGSTAGLGRAIAETLCQAGCIVVINGRNLERTANAAKDIATKCQKEFGKDVIPIHGDTSDSSQAQTIVETIRTEVGRLDILVNNAGINLPEAPFEEQYGTAGAWDKICKVNINGPMNMTHAALPLIKETSSAGRIINVSSMIGHVGSPTNPLYCMTKAAMLSFTQSLALDLAKTKTNPQEPTSAITVNSVSPGAFITDMNAKFSDDLEAKNAIESAIPMGRMGLPSELAGSVLFLASNSSSYMTGGDIVVDGGYVAI
mmetsp:Transcript_27591/g.48944  ORF Transcript_27591/g.48944 Transcript_27591/m.48944 type:complete len:280 (-) Transcript_27591:498-1337(-)